MVLGAKFRQLVRKFLAKSRRARWDQTRDVKEVLAELKRNAIYGAVPYGIGTAVWKSVSPTLQTLLPKAVYEGLSTGIDTYAIPLCGAAIGVYLAWRGWVVYRVLRKLRCSSDT